MRAQETSGRFSKIFARRAPTLFFSFVVSLSLGGVARTNMRLVLDRDGSVVVTPGQASTTVARLEQTNPVSEPNPPSPLSHKQKKELLKLNVAKMKRDAEELATLAQLLQQDVSASSENVLSLQVVDKAERIEKLARKIRNEAKGN